MDASAVIKLDENIENQLQNAENALSKLLSIACRINVSAFGGYVNGL